MAFTACMTFRMLGKLPHERKVIQNIAKLMCFILTIVAPVLLG